MVNKFEKLGLSHDILKSLQDLGFSEPTEVQERAIPLVLEGHNIVAGSKTGSGKTLAFGAGMIERAQKGKGIQGLVLTPTRELAEQVMESIKDYSKHKNLGVCSVYGGVSMNPQITLLKRSEIVVATPGRLLDHIRSGTINLSHVRIVALDEADIMFDMGFLPQTLCEDGDPLDAFVIMRTPTFPGCLVPSRVIGVMIMEDDDEQDDKLICVPIKDKYMEKVQDISDLPKQQIEEIKHFLEHYKDVKGGKVIVTSVEGKQKAIEVFESSCKMYKQ